VKKEAKKFAGKEEKRRVPKKGQNRGSVSKLRKKGNHKEEK
jgi:hypothetical protein